MLRDHIFRAHVVLSKFQGRFYCITVEPFLKDHPIGHKTGLSRQVVYGDKIKCTEKKSGTFYQEYVVLQNEWSIMSVIWQKVSLYNASRFQTSPDSGIIMCDLSPTPAL